MYYADDTQIYTYFTLGDPESENQAIARVQACVDDIKEWMCWNYLKLNEKKTEVLIISRKSKQSSSTFASVDIGGHPIIPVACVRNLGVMIDSSALMDKQINNLCKSAYFALRNISRVRKFLSTEAAKSLVHSFVSSRLDYCNSLLFGIPQYQMNKLQRVLNCAARVVARVNRREHITGTLMELHWLPVSARIQYKVLLLTFKALYGLAPQYLSSLICVYTPARDLRSTDSGLLQVPAARLKSYGHRAFTHCAPVLWNKLPHELRTQTSFSLFKRHLKTLLFRQSYF